ncbi:MAG TPA: transketolase [Spirochaetota bacterium]|nr:transketolase [Spirochaetota bacterium]
MHITTEDLALIANTVRTLSMDAVQKANSGHPGMPMGCADIAAVLWAQVMIYNPADPGWANRDRFILSAGHGSMLLYSMLHMSGYDLTLDDIKNFRQLNSKTPGHPEFRHTPGVETTTGPLGQGFANAVGMAYAAKMLGREFNAPGTPLIDHRIYAIVSDGDIMEGVASEAASLAGHLGLGNIVFVYDSNGISIEGSTDLTFSEDVADRFRSYNWHVQKIDGHNYEEIFDALTVAKHETEKPSIIIARTDIAKGSPNKQGTADSHGAPLGDEEIRNAKECIGCCVDDFFCVPERVYEIFNDRNNDLKELYTQWQEFSQKILQGDTGARWKSFFATPDINALREKLPSFETGTSVATRNAGGKILEALFKELPNLMGGSADLGPSNKTFVKGFDESGKNALGRNIHFGIREHAMGSFMNGIAYYGGFIPFGSTFFVFMDYMRPPVRIAALSGLQSVFVFTHDSIFVGEDGPTHQPVEQLAAARAIPNLTVIRPADAEETREAWLAAIANISGPTALLLTRQNLPVLERSKGAPATDLHKGAYIVYSAGTTPDVLILASGTEVHPGVEAALKLKDQNINAAVISFPSWELFDKQSGDYKKSILPPSVTKRVVIEAGISMGWEKYAGPDALFITMESFGTSAPAELLAEKYGFTTEHAIKKISAYCR